MGFEKERRPFLPHQIRLGDVVESTAASTALQAAGVVSLVSTSTTAFSVHTLAEVPRPGVFLAIHATGVASSSGAHHINAGGTAAGEVAFGTSSEDMIEMSSEGSGVLLIGLSSDRWAVVGNYGATFSTST